MRLQTTPPPIPKKRFRDRFDWVTLLIGVAVGALYGLFLRYSFDLGGHSESHQGGRATFEVMSASFLFLAPLTLGFVTVCIVGWASRIILVAAIFLPWLTILGCMAGCFALRWEGSICLILWLPGACAFSSLGGILAWVIIRFFRKGRGTLYCAGFIVFLPFIGGPIESLVERQSEIRTVRNTVLIDAPLAVVWEQIRSVPRIRESEHSFAWIHALGFPRPTEAVLHGDGVGAIRMARFEGDVLFVEKVDVFTPEKQLSFSITADTANIPPTTFDEHVIVGGKYFDVLHGSYRMSRMADGKVLLELSSDQRLSTGFNFYSHWWTEWFMSDLQGYIMNIIKVRCEKEAERQKEGVSRS